MQFLDHGVENRRVICSTPTGLESSRCGYRKCLTSPDATGDCPRTIDGMVAVVLFDLGDTLVDGARPFPHVPEALSAVRQFKSASGASVGCALVSDFTLAVPATAARVDEIVSEYLALLGGFDLRGFFSPVERCVTLSTHAGVMKPDRRVYELALARLGGGAQLTDCLCITENAGHISACRTLGMRTLQFGVDFTDWAEFALLVRHQIDPTDTHNTFLALEVWLAAHTDVRIVDIPGPISARTARIHIRPAGGGATQTATASFDSVGRVTGWTVNDDPPGPGEQLFEESLREHGQLAEGGPEGAATGRNASGANRRGRAQGRSAQEVLRDLTPA